MIEPIQLGDEFFPYVEAPIGSKKRYIRRPDWDNGKQISLNLRTIDYFMQFEDRHGSAALINLIEGYYITDYANADKAQQARYDRLLTISQSWT